MSNEMFNEKLADLMNVLHLERIIAPKLDFCLEQGSTFSVAKYKSNISRSASVLSITDSLVTVSFGFEVKGSNEEQPLFVGHFHYQIVYKHSDKQLILTLMDDEKVNQLFLINQSDKLVWSYFRKTLQDMVVDAGLPPLVLPLYR
ncbi:MAG: protein-export chaperone SecB [Candidatus Cloacimonas sp.]|jgi:preprotein translocase subunit SecB|nr:protein-export chaperone SecB [Candidatus Cloacimonas sp.]